MDLEEEEEAESAVLIFVNEWLRAVADCVVGLVAAQLLRVSSLSEGGAAQLRADLEYLSNVIDAMGVRSHPLLGHIKLLMFESNSTVTCSELDSAVSHSLSSKLCCFIRSYLFVF